MLDPYARRLRRKTLLLYAAIIAAALVGWGIGSRARAEPSVSGPARVTDGDTLTVGSTKVRLYGIDAPEAAQRCMDVRKRSWGCGTSAAHRLEVLIGGSPVTCQSRGKDDFDRVLGTCSAGGVELNAALVREGLAWAFVRYSDTYLPQEREARVARRGVFAAENVTPWDYRAGRWEGAQAQVTADRARTCPIKGNVSGENRIYHMPWQRDYARVKVDERRGEQWFCDEAEAEKAGWRRAAR